MTIQVIEDLIRAKNKDFLFLKGIHFRWDFTFKAYRLIGSDGNRRGNTVVKSSGTCSNSLQSWWIKYSTKP